MRMFRVRLAVALAAGIGLLGATQAASQKAGKTAMSQSGTLLSGTIRSASGQAQEGITVSARAEASTITTSVFTDEDGLYILPPLEKGKYRVWAQAVGFETGRAQVDLDGTAAARRDFVLRPAKDVARQMTGADWFASLPEDTREDRRIKNVLYSNCAGCHQPNYALQNRFDQAGWGAIIDLMKMVNVIGIRNRRSPLPLLHHHQQELAAYLSKVRGPDTSAMKVKVVSRPKGEATLAVITEYAIELAGTPGEYPTQDGSDWSEGVPTSLNGVRGTHEVELDFAGNLWVANSQDNPNRTYAKIDPKTGQLTSYRVLSPKGKVRTSHGMRKDANGILWLTLSGGEERFGPEDGGLASLARLDPTTGKVDIYTTPKGMTPVDNGSIEVDGKGKIWTSTQVGAVRFDPDTGKFLEFKSQTFFKATAETCRQTSCGATYGVAADSEGNGYWAQMAIDIVGKSDIATGKSLEIKMPPRSDRMEIVTPEDRKLYEEVGSDWNSAAPWAQGPRRLSGDRTGNAVWVANYWGDNLAKIDIHRLKVTQYPAPTKYSGIYGTVVDKNHVVWANMMNNDSVAKFDPATEKWTEYMLPTHGAEARHIAVNDRQYPPVVAVPYSRSSKAAVLRFRTKQDFQALKKQVQSQRLQAQSR